MTEATEPGGAHPIHLTPAQRAPHQKAAEGRAAAHLQAETDYAVGSARGSLRPRALPPFLLPAGPSWSAGAKVRSYQSPKFVPLSHFRRGATSCSGEETDFFFPPPRRKAEADDRRDALLSQFSRALSRVVVGSAPGRERGTLAVAHRPRGCSRTRPTRRGRRWSLRPGRRCRPCAGS